MESGHGNSPSKLSKMLLIYPVEFTTCIKFIVIFLQTT